MNYADFRLAFATTLAGSGLAARADASERFDFRDLERTCEVSVEPPGGQDAAPFDVGATLSWEWDALLEARSATTEEEMLMSILGRDHGAAIETERPWLQVFVTLEGLLPMGQSMPMPPQAALQAWAQEVVGRLGRTEPLFPGEVVEETNDGDSLMGWRGTPQVRAACAPDGTLKLERVELLVWETIDLPRIWEDPEREDDGPNEQLAAFFARVLRALQVWMESLRHLAHEPRS